MKNIIKNAAQVAKIIAIATVLSFGLSYVYAWTAPTVSPPGGNTAAPINTSTTAQVKDGGLSVNAFSAFANAYIAGNLMVGTTTAPRNLEVNGDGQISGVLSSGKVQIVDVVTENTACTPDGLVARDSGGLLLSCQSKVWKKAAGGSAGTVTVRTSIGFVSGYAAISSCLPTETVVGGGGICTSSGAEGTPGVLNVSIPSGNGWYVECYYSSPSAYAMCMQK